MLNRPDPKDIADQPGWKLGISAALKSLLGTNTEMHMHNGSTIEAIRHAKTQVDRMSEEAEELLGLLDTERGPLSKADQVGQTLEALIKDL